MGGRMRPLPVVCPAALTSAWGRVYQGPALLDAQRLGPDSALSCCGQLKEPASASPTLPGIVYLFQRIPSPQHRMTCKSALTDPPDGAASNSCSAD